MKHWQRGIAGLIGVALAAFLFVGCYTVLRHPQVETDLAEDAYACASCHADADLYHFRDPFMHSYGHFDVDVSPWYGYYVVPWWYDGYWYYPHDGSEDSQIQSGGGRLWDRSTHTGQAPLPRVGTAPAGSDPNAKPSAEGGKKEEEKKKKDKKRRLWGRGK
jgi:hypothetical protein